MLYFLSIHKAGLSATHYLLVRRLNLKSVGFKLGTSITTYGTPFVKQPMACDYLRREVGQRVTMAQSYSAKPINISESNPRTSSHSNRRTTCLTAPASTAELLTATSQSNYNSNDRDELLPRTLTDLYANK